MHFSFGSSDAFPPFKDNLNYCLHCSIFIVVHQSTIVLHRSDTVCVEPHLTISLLSIAIAFCHYLLQVQNANHLDNYTSRDHFAATPCNCTIQPDKAIALRISYMRLHIAVALRIKNV